MNPRPQLTLTRRGSGFEHTIGHGDVTVNGANIHFNGDVDVQSHGLVATGGTISVEGSASGPLGNYVPDPVTGQPAIDDPLADWPDKPDMSLLTNKSVAPCIGGPGIYAGYTINGGTCDLEDGVYVITGLWKMGGSGGTIRGDNVTLFFTCKTGSTPRPCLPGESGGSIDMGGKGALVITAPTAGPYSGMALWFDRNNAVEAKLHGNGLSDMVGTIYGRAVDLRLTGNACLNALDSLVIVKDLDFDGEGTCMTLNYSKKQNVKIPPHGLHLDQ